MSLLSANQLHYVYSEKTPFRKHAVSGIDFSLEKGEIIGIIGHTGSGKSTLVQMLNGLLTPSSGEVLFDGDDINSDKKTLHATRFKVGLVFQYPEYQLFDETVFRDISFGPKNMGLGEDEVKRRVYESAKAVGLDENLLEKSPFDLSGGQKRRAAIAGVIAMEPEVLILDEPTAGLDPSGRQLILDMIKKLNREYGMSVVLVSHNMEDIAQLSDKILVLSGGKSVAFDTPQNIFSDGEKIAEMGLELPVVTKMLLSLRKKGLPVNCGLFTPEDFAKEILRLKREGVTL